VVASAWDELTKYHSPYYLPYDEAPPPTLYANGWTDDIFTTTEELRWVNRVLSVYPRAPISMFLADIGHQRAQNKTADYRG
jgi:phage terminase large subunit-like protein